MNTEDFLQYRSHVCQFTLIDSRIIHGFIVGSVKEEKEYNYFVSIKNKEKYVEAIHDEDEKKISSPIELENIKLVS